MTTFTKPIFCGDIAGKITQFTSSNGTTTADITTADANGPIRIDSLSVSSNDTAAATMTVTLTDGTTGLGCTSVAVTAAAHVNLLTSTNLAPLVGNDAAGNTFIELPKGWKLRAVLAANPSSGKTLTVQARWGTYAAA